MKRLPMVAVVAALLSMSSTALASPGDRIWIKRYNGPGNFFDFAYDVAASPDGTKVYVTGVSFGLTGYDYATVAYDASSGAKIWARLYNGTGNSADSASAVVVSPDSTKVYVTGQSTGSGGDDYATVAYDASSGAEIWTRRYNGTGNFDDTAAAVAVSSDGARVYVTGASTGSASGTDYATVAYDASTGGRIWTRRYNGTGNSDDGADAVAVSSDGTTVYVTGYSIGSVSGKDYATLAYDASTGAKIWAQRYTSAKDFGDSAYDLAVSPDGTRVFVTGVRGGSGYEEDYATIAYGGSTGGEIWTKRYDGPESSFDDAYALGVSPDGTRVYVTGYSLGSTWDAVTIAYGASTGAEIWNKRHDGGSGSSQDFAYDLAVSPDGARVYVTGGSKDSTSAYDFATVAYDPLTGAETWSKVYNGPGNSDDEAKSVAVSPDGAKVYVTGGSPGSTSEEDYATIAYEA